MLNPFECREKKSPLVTVYFRVGEQSSCMNSIAFNAGVAHDNLSILDIVTFTSQILKKK